MNTDPNGYRSIAESKIAENAPYREANIKKEMVRMAAEDGYKMAVGNWYYDPAGNPISGPAMRADAIVPLVPETLSYKKATDKEIDHPLKARIKAINSLMEIAKEFEEARRDAQDYSEGYHIAQGLRIYGRIPTNTQFDIMVANLPEKVQGKAEEAINLISTINSGQEESSSGAASELMSSVIGRLKETGLANEVFEMSNAEIEDKLIELGVDAETAKQVTAWHGSPYSFDRFTTEAMSTGAGFQSFGWGLYFTDLESIAKVYADSKNLYKVTLHKGKTPDQYTWLEWDKSLTDTQLDLLVKQANKENIDIDVNVIKANKVQAKDLYRELGTLIAQQKGVEFSKSLDFLNIAIKEASLFLLRSGIDGIKYPDESISLGETPEVKKGFNYVVFDENAITIEEQIRFQKTRSIESRGGQRGTQFESAVAPESIVKFFNINTMSNTLDTKDAMETLSAISNYIDLDVSITSPTYSELQAFVEQLNNKIDSGSVDFSVIEEETGVTQKDIEKFLGTAEKRLASFEARNNIQFQTQPLSDKGINLTTAGFVYNGDVYLNMDNMNLDTPIHEFGHLWLSWAKNNLGEAYARGLELAKSSEADPYRQYVMDTQPDLAVDSNEFLEEVLAQAIGDNGARLVEENSTKTKSWLQDLWDAIGKMLGLSQFTASEIQNMSLGQFSRAIAVDLLKGSPIDQLYSNEIYKSGDIRVEVSYIEEAKKQELIAKGFLKETDNLNHLSEGLFITTSPDDMLVGTVNILNTNGEIIESSSSTEGNGGLYYVTKYGNVWAFSNLKRANSAISVINKALTKNGGKTHLVLTKGTDAKLLSNAQGVSSTLKVTEALLDANLISTADMRSSIVNALKTFKDTSINIPLNLSAKDLKKQIDSYFSDVNSSTFEERGNVLKQILSNIKATDSFKNNKDKIAEFLKVDSEFLNLKENFINTIALVSAEKFTKGLSGSDIYASIEITSPVSIDETQDHKTFGYGIVMKDENDEKIIPTLTLISGKHSAYDLLDSEGNNIEDVKGKRSDQEKSFRARVTGANQMGLGSAMLSINKENISMTDTTVPQIEETTTIPECV
jgi:hypothetical protein